MSTGLSRRTETFIVRLWAEYLVQRPPAWRGEIEHVGRGEVVRFGSLGEMSHFIQRCARPQHHPEEEEVHE
jgi:hypothetical protein